MPYSSFPFENWLHKIPEPVFHVLTDVVWVTSELMREDMKDYI